MNQIERVPVSFQIRGTGIINFKHELDMKLDEIEKVIDIVELFKATKGKYDIIELFRKLSTKQFSEESYLKNDEEEFYNIYVKFTLKIVFI